MCALRPNVTPSMPSDSLKNALLDIRDSILLAQEFVQGLTLESFTTSRLHYFAATRALEIISEASRRLPDALRARHPLIPWRAIRDAGNVYRHHYDNVEEAIVWKTVHDELPALLAVIEEEINRN
jgi:uncharacterized protein with HEPN domain